MKKAEVKIGGKYYANVTGNEGRGPASIAEKPRGGWEATNLATGKKIHIKSCPATSRRSWQRQNGCENPKCTRSHRAGRCEP
jgi:hypothetical protein